jgi:hypothetical protein
MPAPQACLQGARHKKNPQLARKRQQDLVYDFKAFPGSVILTR